MFHNEGNQHIFSRLCELIFLTFGNEEKCNWFFQMQENQTD